MNLSDDDIKRIAELLSEERIRSLIALTNSEREAIELHHRILQQGASLMAIIAIVEIALRNTVCDCLRRHFGTDDWLLNPPNPFEWRESERGKKNHALNNARRAKYAKLTQAEKHALDAIAYPNGRPANISHKSRTKARQATIEVPEGQIIAELTLFFWKRVYSSDYEESLWKPSLKRSFPDKTLKRSHVAKHLEQIYQSRNRLAHHEPVIGWRLNETIKSIEFVTRQLGSDKGTDENPLAKLIADDISDVKARAAILEEKLAKYGN